MKKCPFCAVPIPIKRSEAEIGAVQVTVQKKEIMTWTEEIQDEAIKCRFCNEFLSARPETPKTPWYCKSSVLAICFLTVGPFALPLVWLHPVFSFRKKIILTVIVLALTYWLGSLFLHSAKTIFDYYKQVGIF